MSAYILCQEKKAEHPFYIENIRTNIYTIEELCYYLYHNLYLIDQSIMNEDLCDWIQNELEIPKLAAKLRPVIGKFASESDVLYPIFRQVNYLTYEELKQLNAQLERLDKETPLIREKKKGDALMKNKMYVQAMHVYQKLLERPNLERSRVGLTASIWNNLGCAYSNLFQMEKAVECFQEAYVRSGSRENLKRFLMAYSSIHTPGEFASLLEELSVSEEVLEELKGDQERFARKPAEEFDPEDVDGILERLTRAYHRSTGS